MKVLFVTSEAVPLVKTGGLADVSGALPIALRQQGIDVRVMLPGYGAVLGWVDGSARMVAELALPAFPPARLLEAELPSGVPLLVLDCPELYAREGGPYQQATGSDWPDNDIRFGLLSRAAALLAHESSPLTWRPDVLHCNDWQTALAPTYLAFMPGARARTLMTIHNLAYQGIFPTTAVPRVGLPWESFKVDGVEFYGNLSFLKGGLFYADRLNTVSPTYAREIQHEPLGFGLQGLLAWRTKDLSGILNGIDTDAWNPATDPLIPRRYRSATLGRKIDNKRALQERVRLEPSASTPLVGVVSRFTYQKGLDLLLAAAERMLKLPVQLVVLGSGDAPLESSFLELAALHPGKIAVQVGFDEALSHLIEAGADAFLMPSRYEPSGLNQMYSQRYGTPVIARATGGLVDSVVDCTPETRADGTCTGFLFAEPTPDALYAAVERAVATYHDRRVWRQLQRHGMDRDYSWDASARGYAALYEAVTKPT
ncbi:MAG: glycogen synthase GlgA [Betaproteobacteria bacterium]